MANIFKERQDYAEKVNRSTFDLSHRNNLTTKIGQITPILCQECLPGDSYQIKTDLGLRFSPLAFPIQTPLVASVQYFAVPHRILWKNFEDYMGDFKEGIVHPYIDQEYMWHPTGSLADYLGVPSTYASDSHEVTRNFGLYGRYTTVREVPDPITYAITGNATTESNTTTPSDYNAYQGIDAYNLNLTPNAQQTTVETLVHPYILYWDNNTTDPLFMQVGQDLRTYSPTNSFAVHGTVFGCFEVSEQITEDISSATITLPLTNPVSDFDVAIITCDNVQDPAIFSLDEGWTIRYKTHYDYTSGDDYDTVETRWLDWIKDAQTRYGNVRFIFWTTDPNVLSFEGINNLGSVFRMKYMTNNVEDVEAVDSPFVHQAGEDGPAIRINALPARCYEAIYNCYFRSNPTVDPFTINGDPEYNKWITNDGDGADSTTPLDLKFRNYELDYLTSAVNTPQQGEAPLVGVSSTGTFTFKDENNVEYTAQAIIDPDTGKLTGIDTYDPNLPSASLHRLMDTITHGISINDFRNVSALQAWKEKAIRTGYRYFDVVKAHFGVEAKNAKHDQPIFIGGFTREVNVNQITSSTSTTEISLGDYGGQASLFANSEHSITHYCDEHCFIMAVLTIVPIPVYSQTLDPMFVKENLLSYAWPEFNHLGYQSIPYLNVTPIESYVKSKDTLEDELHKTFGYQRPYWELVAKTDQAHSHMRTDMANYLMTRYFDAPPELGHDFLQVNAEHLTSPFVDTDANADNIIGQVSFNISAQRPVSRMAIPRLEP